MNASLRSYAYGGPAPAGFGPRLPPECDGPDFDREELLDETQRIFADGADFEQVQGWLECDGWEHVARLLSLLYKRGLPSMDQSERDDALRDEYDSAMTRLAVEFASECADELAERRMERIRDESIQDEAENRADDDGDVWDGPY